MKTDFKSNWLLNTNHPVAPPCRTNSPTRIHHMKTNPFAKSRASLALVTLLLLCFSIPSLRAEVFGLFTYQVVGGATVEITDYPDNAAGPVNIPAEIGGKPVTSIRGGTFQSCTGLTSVTIPNSVTTIGYGAFSGCTGLTSVTIPDSVTSIRSGTFQNCTGLTSVTIPNSVTSIEYVAFAGCTGLTSVTIPNSVTTIGYLAFGGCTGLTSVTIPNSVTTFDFLFEGWVGGLSFFGGAFYGCSGLTSVTLQQGLTIIGEGMFAGCTSLTNVTIPSSVTSIGSGAFAGCTGLTNVTIPSSVTSIGQQAFYGCTGLTSVTISNSVTSIGVYAFSGCTGLTSVTIPNSVTTIGPTAFSGCTGLTSVTIPEGVTSIGYSAFSGCTGLTGLYFQGRSPGLENPDSTFEGANQATVYYLPGSTGWDTTFGGRPTALWALPNPVILNHGPSLGVQTNGFGFIISWATNLSVVVEACTGLANPIWTPVGTNTLTGGSSYFSDPEWTNYPTRLYRLRTP